MEYKLPYNFILNALYPIRPIIKKRLGGYFLYHDKKLIFYLRERDNQPEFNGIFLATQPESYRALETEIHTSRMQFDLDGTIDSWIFISEDVDEFETKVKKACNMLKAGDTRIGR